MKTVRTVADLRAELDAPRRAGRSIGLVPTMGAFHDGHRSLMRAARARHDVVVVSLFVNPLQFGAAEDLDRYPDDRAGDLAAAAAEGVDLVFAPPVDEMYPGTDFSPAGAAPLTTVSVAGLTDGLCGSARPGHFDGVATVVTKLFGIVGPSTAYFGKKDAQQLAVVRRLAADLCLPVEIVGCPLVREPDGLAMSSRNVRLKGADRDRALALSEGLRAAEAAVREGQTDAEEVLTVATKAMLGRGITPEYLAAVDPDSLAPLRRIEGRALVVVAAEVGPVRLIDNVIIEPAAP
jgi:pantoate--beta-alanine ligase